MNKLWMFLLSVLLVFNFATLGCGGSYSYDSDAEESSESSTYEASEDSYEDEDDFDEAEESEEEEGAADWIIEAVEGDGEDDE